MYDKPVDKLRERVRDAAREVFDEIGEGHIESIYEEAITIEFKKRFIGYAIWKGKDIFYKGIKVGVDRPDFIVQDQLAVEIKTGEKITNAVRLELASYLRDAKLEFGLIVNFPSSDENNLQFADIPEKLSST